MKITKNNLNEIIFENHDARLLIEDVVLNTNADLFYYFGYEITISSALDVWYSAVKLEEYSRVNA